MSDTIDVADLLVRLHQMNGHRIALMRQFADEDAKDLLRVYGESVAFTVLIRGLEIHRADGQFGDPPDSERFDAYEAMSRAMIRADNLAGSEPDPDGAEEISFQ